MSDGLSLEHVNLARERNVAEIRRFLARFDLSFEETVDFTVALRDQDGQLVGTGSFAGEVLRNIAVDETLQGAGLTGRVLSALMQEMARRGTLHYFLYTRPEKAHLFESLGFAEVARAEGLAALLESGLGSIGSWCAELAEECASLPEPRAAVVINANPFTLGHLRLIESARQEGNGLIVFVVSEDASLFPFADRIRLIREGTAHLQDVAVVPGGRYIISPATFPTYFTKGDRQVLAQTLLDATIFATRIAPALGIGTRFVGEEPYCATTRAYNEALAEILPRHRVALRVMPRASVGDRIVSASTVRELIREERLDEVSALVPSSTMDYLRQPENRDILARIRASRSRH